MKTFKRIGFSVAIVLIFVGLAVAWNSEPRDMLWNGLQVFKQSVTFDGTTTFNSTQAINGTTTYTLGATEKVLLDGSTTAQTQTDGVLDINMSSGTANTAAINLSVTTPTGTAAATDVFAGIITLTQNDADADMFGLKITAAATTNAAAGSYEYGLGFDCVENTAGGCLDGIRIESSGINNGLTDGIDVSAANIANAINIGVNPILGGNSETFNIGATDATFLFTRNDAGAVTLTSADNDTTADLTVDPGGNAILTLGSASDTVKVAATSGITLSNDESINNGTDGAFDFTRSSAGTVTITTSDDDATADLTIDPGGNSILTLGSASDTVTVAATSGINLSNLESVSNGTNGTITLGRNDAGTVTLNSKDDDATAALTIDPGGNAALTLGSSGDTVTVGASTGISSPLASLTGPVVTAGSGTGVTVSDAGSLRTQVYKVTVGYTNFTSAAVTHDLVIATLPAKSIVHSVLANVATPFVCGAVCTTATLSATLGVAAGGVDFLESFDIDAAAAWFGDADAEVGSKLDVAAATNGGFPVPAGGAVTLRATSGTGNWGDGASATNLTAGSIEFYILYSILP